ncbi:hypothetical protein LTS18_003923, partial [Coniosporium uncinatum]
MHELPRTLTSDLRSYRGSTYTPSDARQHTDLEKGEDYGESEHEHGSRHDLRDANGNTPNDDVSRDRARARGLQAHRTATHSANAKRTKGTEKANGKGKDEEDKPSSRPTGQDPSTEDVDSADSEPLTRENFYDLIGMQAPVDGRAPKKL